MEENGIWVSEDDKLHTLITDNELLTSQNAALEGRLESYEMWCWGRMEEIKCPEKVTNEILKRTGQKRTFLNNILLEKPIGLVVF